LNKKVEMTLLALMWVGQRPLRLICVFSLALVWREVAPDPSLVSLRTLVSRSWIERLEPLTPWGFIGVGHVSRVTPFLASATGGAELTTLVVTARVSRSMSSLTGMSVWNLGQTFADGVGRALMWHSTTA